MDWAFLEGYGLATKVTDKQVTILKREYGNGWWMPQGLCQRLMSDAQFMKEFSEAGARGLA
jgi:hypothetical protein